MDQLGFLDLVTIEVLTRPFEVNTLDTHLLNRLDKSNVKKRHREAIKVAESGNGPLPGGAEEEQEEPVVVAKPSGSIRGHTGYLTFARTKL